MQAGSWHGKLMLTTALDEPPIAPCRTEVPEKEDSEAEDDCLRLRLFISLCILSISEAPSST